MASPFFASAPKKTGWRKHLLRWGILCPIYTFSNTRERISAPIPFLTLALFLFHDTTMSQQIRTIVFFLFDVIISAVCFSSYCCLQGEKYFSKCQKKSCTRKNPLRVCFSAIQGNWMLFTTSGILPRPSLSRSWQENPSFCSFSDSNFS